MERIKELARTEDSFIYPEDFDPEEKLRSAFNITMDDPIKVRIRFSSGQARYIRERHWADEQVIEEEANGSVIISLQTSGWWDIKRWVLSFGCEAEILEPVELREEVRGDVERMGEMYNDSIRSKYGA